MTPGYLDGSVRDLLQAFSAPEPTPGGGSAAALAGAVGAALLVMVASLPRTRSDAETERDSLGRVLAPLRQARDRLAALVEEDARAYQAVVAAYRLPKATVEERAERTQAIQAALEHATRAPLDTLRWALAALGAAEVVARDGTTRAASDVGVAVDLLAVAARGAHANVQANLEGLVDGTHARALGAEAARLAEEAARAAEQARRWLAAAAP
jgi:formiminotetrahydrofolate cyclodeaminase